MKNLDFKMRERFHRREQDEDRRQAIEFRKLSKMKAASYAEDEFFDNEKMRECVSTPEELERIQKIFEEGISNASDS